MTGFMAKRNKSNQLADFRTDDSPNWLKESEDGIIIAIHAKPGAKTDAVAGLFGERLKIALAAPPVDGKANAKLAAFLAAKLGVTKSAVKLISGETGRDKRVAISGISAAQAQAALLP